MQVRDLIEQLQMLPEDAEVQIAYQPSYPLAAQMLGVSVKVDEEVDVEGENRDVLPAEEYGYFAEGSAVKMVYLVAGSAPYDAPYAPRACWDL